MNRRFIVVGLGVFGSGVAQTLYEQGFDVNVIDVDLAKINRIAPRVTHAIVGDARDADVLKQAGAEDADIAVVSTGDDISASILTVLTLRDLGVAEIYAKVISFDHARILRKIGANETVFPEHESSRNLAHRLGHSESLLKYFRWGADFSMQEMAVPNKWKGLTLRTLELRTKFGVSVVAVRDVLTDKMTPVPDPDAPLKDSDTLLLAGSDEKLNRVAGID